MASKYMTRNVSYILLCTSNYTQRLNKQNQKTGGKNGSNCEEEESGCTEPQERESEPVFSIDRPIYQLCASLPTSSTHRFVTSPLSSKNNKEEGAAAAVAKQGSHKFKQATFAETKQKQIGSLKSDRLGKSSL